MARGNGSLLKVTKRLTHIVYTRPRHIMALAHVGNTADYSVCRLASRSTYSIINRDTQEVVNGVCGLDSIRRGEQDTARQRKST